MMEEKSSKNENKEFAVRMLPDQQKDHEVSIKYGRDEVAW